MNNETEEVKTSSEIEMQDVRKIISQLIAIMQDSGITQTSLVTILDGKCARNTILNLLKGSEDCKLSTLLMILDACGVELRLDTERSREAIMAGDIAAYRTETERLRAEVDTLTSEKDALQYRYDELIDKNTKLTSTIEKQQGQIDRYMSRMEKAENEIYSALSDIRRKDAKIVELMGK